RADFPKKPVMAGGVLQPGRQCIDQDNASRRRTAGVLYRELVGERVVQDGLGWAILGEPEGRSADLGRGTLAVLELDTGAILDIAGPRRFQDEDDFPAGATFEGAELPEKFGFTC